MRWWLWGSAVASFSAVLLGGWLTPVRVPAYRLFIGAEPDLMVLGLVLLGVSFVVSSIAMVMLLRAGTYTTSRSRWKQSKFGEFWRVLSELSATPRKCVEPGHRSWSEHARHDDQALPMCGVSGGASLGAGLVLLGFMAFWVPREVDSVSVLLAEEVRLDGGRDGAVAEVARDEPLLDGFGNAVSYQRTSADGQAYTLRSLGPDGTWSTDDLCVFGHTRNLLVRGRARGAEEFQRALATGRVDWDDQLKALQQLRCYGTERLSARASR